MYDTPPRSVSTEEILDESLAWVKEEIGRPARAWLYKLISSYDAAIYLYGVLGLGPRLKKPSWEFSILKTKDCDAESYTGGFLSLQIGNITGSFGFRWDQLREGSSSLFWDLVNSDLDLGGEAWLGRLEKFDNLFETCGTVAVGISPNVANWPRHIRETLLYFSILGGFESVATNTATRLGFAGARVGGFFFSRFAKAALLHSKGQLTQLGGGLKVSHYALQTKIPLKDLFNFDPRDPIEKVLENDSLGLTGQQKFDQKTIDMAIAYAGLLKSFQSPPPGWNESINARLH